MARKRKLDATVPEESLNPPLDTETGPKSAMGGMWGGSAMNMLKQRIEDANGSLHQGILSGTVAISLSPDQIKDGVGSDRFTDWETDEDFTQLVANIKRRGQKQPIRIRPEKADWTPDLNTPLETKDSFIIQSGRRRLAACRMLDIPVLAIVAMPEADQLQADLEERFHENTMRRDLNGFEELISIGALSRFMTDKTQQEIADHLGVSQGDISLGVSCLEYQKSILKYVDIQNTPKRAYRAILPKIKRGDYMRDPLGVHKPLAETERLNVRGFPMKTKRVGTGYDLQISSAKVSEDHLDQMLVDIAKVIMRYQLKKK